MRTLGAARVKAQFLSIADEVEQKREPVLITKNGRPVAKIVPLELEQEDPIFGFYRNGFNIVGDIVSPIYTDQQLAEFEEASVRNNR